MFNPQPKLSTVAIPGRAPCVVVDDALLEPQRLRDYARERRAEFSWPTHNAYPGRELRMPDGFSAQLDDVFRQHARTLLGARRTLALYSRLSMVTLRPEQLQPGQSVCHQDRLLVAPEQLIAASVLYLFDDPRLGGTSFYAPTRSPAEVGQLMGDAGRMDPASFQARHGVAQGYMTTGNAYFAALASVPAKFNRLIFYDASIFHSGQIDHPELLRDDPETGRLTLNGFFTCSRAAA
ncbi:hypothetical protein SAMN05428989_1860 [Pseudoxanthomonas sp. GM95]|uniref:DUF6445 family protein n=1 Tax=Pseudoxanthomonas sp. GM95 TaxID=1881043 RepID=UPI0008ABCBE6|nr:DUF6445 family protein [Pseudoxanthomonas sp. GM95]SEL53281.1 hypothetical protein SAMN05428989_1860 [Pseudoxanthomonas sp. GM95]